MSRNIKRERSGANLLLRLHAGTATAADCAAAACALELARELFVLASTTSEQRAESRARVSGDAKELARATAVVESKRAAAVACFNQATGLSGTIREACS